MPSNKMHLTRLGRICVTAALFATVFVCLYWGALSQRNNRLQEFEATLISLRWTLLVCAAVWCITFLSLHFSLNDLPLVGLLIVAVLWYIVSQQKNLPATDAIILLFGVVMGKATSFFLRNDGQHASVPAERVENGLNGSTPVSAFLICLTLLLAVSSWLRVDMTNMVYHGPRWTGLWKNPNDYGLLVGTGLVLATGLIASNLKYRIRSPKTTNLQSVEIYSLQSTSIHRTAFAIPASKGISLRYWRCIEAIKSTNRNLGMTLLLISAGMMMIGLLFSYSRGAWIGTIIGLLYLVKGYDKFTLWFVVPPILVVVVVICLSWNNTADTATWYIKRLDLSRASAQHRVAAWKAGFKMMRDHPFGIGWDKVMETYQQDYSPPKNGVAAITTNDYLMLGTQLGWPGLLFFVLYVWCRFRNRWPLGELEVRMSDNEVKTSKLTVIKRNYVSRLFRYIATTQLTIGNRQPASSASAASFCLAIPSSVTHQLSYEASLRVVSRAGALVCLVAFWFDGGLFKLAATSVFWILLELGTEARLKVRTDTDERRFWAAKRHIEEGRNQKIEVSSQQSGVSNQRCSFSTLRRAGLGSLSLPNNTLSREECKVNEGSVLQFGLSGLCALRTRLFGRDPSIRG